MGAISLSGCGGAEETKTETETEQVSTQAEEVQKSESETEEQQAFLEETTEPGKTWAVHGVASCETEPASVEITLDTSALTAKAEAPEDYIPAEEFEVSNIKIGEKEYAGDICSLTFQIKNLSDRTLDRAAYVILFKENGNIVGRGSSYAARGLEAGQTSDEESLVDQVAYDEYVLYLNGTGSPAAP